MRRADPVTVSNRRETLHGSAEQAAECLGLRLAKLGVLGSDMRYRAVVLAELLAPAGSRAAARGGSIAIGRQGRGQRLDALIRRGGRNGRPVPALELSDLLPGELGDGARSGPLRQEAQGTGGQVVVGVLKGAPASVGDGEQPGRPTATTVAVGPGVPRLDHAVGKQVVQVPPDGGRGQSQPGRQACGGHRPVLQDQPGNPGPGARLRATGYILGVGSIHRSTTGAPRLIC